MHVAIFQYVLYRKLGIVLGAVGIILSIPALMKMTRMLIRTLGQGRLIADAFLGFYTSRRAKQEFPKLTLENFNH